MTPKIHRFASFPPFMGTAIFAVMFFFALLGLDWIFHSYLPEMPAPPFWAICIPIGIATVVASGLVYILLERLQAEHHAVETLNHELRNALQIMIYVLPSCDARSNDMVATALRRMSTTLSGVSEELGGMKSWEGPQKHPMS